MKTITPAAADLGLFRALDAICLVNVYDLICPHSGTLETWPCINSIRFHPNTSSWRNLWMSHHLFQWLQSFTASNPAPIECCGINFLHLNIIGPFREISCQIEEGLIVKWGGFKNSWSNCHNFASNAFLLVNFDAIQSHGALPEAPALHKLSLDSSWSLLTLEQGSQTPRASRWGPARGKPGI